MTTANQHKTFATSALGVSGADYEKLQRDHSARANRKYLSATLGNALPDGSTSFTTDGRTATFLIGATGVFVDITLTDEQFADLRSRGLIGSFGQNCYA